MEKKSFLAMRQYFDRFLAQCFGICKAGFDISCVFLQRSPIAYHMLRTRIFLGLQSNIPKAKVTVKEGFCIYFFRPRTHPKTSLQCFALAQRKLKAKHCRNVLGRKNKVQNPSLRHFCFVIFDVSKTFVQLSVCFIGLTLSHTMLINPEFSRQYLQCSF